MKLLPHEIADLVRRALLSAQSDGTLPDAALIDIARKSGITAINFTISAPTFEGTVENLAYVDALVEQSPDVFIVVRQYSDIARAKREGKVGIMPGFQYTEFLEADPSRIETFRRLGVRIMQLTYNNRSNFGDGCLEPGNAGLSKAGLAAVKTNNVKIGALQVWQKQNGDWKLLARQGFKLAQRIRLLLDNQLEQRAVLVRQHARKTFERSEPQLGLVGSRLQFAARNRHSAGFHVLVGRNANA